MTEWANYDADGKRVPSDSEHAAGKAGAMAKFQVDVGMSPDVDD
jgi:hypothetical protein